MVRVAIIDDEINLRYLAHPERVIKKMSVLHQPPRAAEKCTHSTVCAMIWEKCGSNYEIIGIQAMADRRKSASIHSLAEALNLCHHLSIDMVCMSIGSSILSDFPKLDGILSRLYNTGIIMVAALSNSGHITLPASDPRVVGVQCDWQRFMEPGQISWESAHPLGIQLTASCAYDGLPVPFYGPSNSYAVPVAGAKIAKLLNAGVKSFPELLSHLKKESCRKAESSLFSLRREEILWISQNFQRQLPWVLIIREDETLDEKIISQMHDGFGYEVVGIRDHASRDIRLFGIKDLSMPLEASVFYLEKHVKSDLICFFSHSEKEASLLRADAVGWIQKNFIKLQGEGQKKRIFPLITEPTEKVFCRELVQLLTED